MADLSSLQMIKRLLLVLTFFTSILLSHGIVVVHNGISYGVSPGTVPDEVHVLRPETGEYSGDIRIPATFYYSIPGDSKKYQAYPRNYAEDAFKGMKGITSITFESLDVDILDPSAFEDCTSLKALNFSGNYGRFAYIKSVDGIVYRTSSSMGGHTSYTLLCVPPAFAGKFDGVQTNEPSVSILSFAQGVTTIVTTPYISKGGYGAMKNLTNFEPANADYNAVDGPALYYREKNYSYSCLAAFPGKPYSEAYIIPDKVQFGTESIPVKSIAKEAFKDCDVHHVVVRNNIKSISSSAFENFKGLISLPGQVDIDGGEKSNVFKGMSGTIYIDGRLSESMLKALTQLPIEGNTVVVNPRYASLVSEYWKGEVKTAADIWLSDIVSQPRCVRFKLNQSDEVYKVRKIVLGDREFAPEENGVYIIDGLEPERDYEITIDYSTKHHRVPRTSSGPEPVSYPASCKDMISTHKPNFKIVNPVSWQGAIEYDLEYDDADIPSEFERGVIALGYDFPEGETYLPLSSKHHRLDGLTSNYWVQLTPYVKYDDGIYRFKPVTLYTKKLEYVVGYKATQSTIVINSITPKDKLDGTWKPKGLSISIYGQSLDASKFPVKLEELCPDKGHDYTIYDVVDGEYLKNTTGTIHTKSATCSFRLIDKTASSMTVSYNFNKGDADETSIKWLNSESDSNPRLITGIVPNANYQPAIIVTFRYKDFRGKYLTEDKTFLPSNYYAFKTDNLTLKTLKTQSGS